MTPPRLKRWILIWTPVVWIALELLRYPKTVPIQSGVVKLLRGFFSNSVGDYPAAYLFIAAYIFAVVGIGALLPSRIKSARVSRFVGYAIAAGAALAVLGFCSQHNFVFGWFHVSVRAFAPYLNGLAILFFVLSAIVLPLVVPTRRPESYLPFGLVATGATFVVWGLLNGGLLDKHGFSFGGRTGYYAWLIQMIVVVLIGTSVWLWGKGNPERAVLTVRNGHRLWGLFRGNRQGMIGLWIIVAIVLIAMLAPFLADHAKLAPDAQIGPTFQGPSPSYYKLMGTDDQGLSILAEFIWSARISLVVGIMATIISTILGAGIGVAAGYFGGWIGEIGMRITDAFLCIPWLPLAMVLAAAWGQNYLVIIIIVGVTSWPGTARVVRADALRVRELQFVERAQAIGSTHFHIMKRHVLPNVFPLVFANTILVVAAAITSETELSFLGLGDPLNFSWGTMLHNAWGSGAATLPAWWWILPPGLAIVFVVLAFTFMGTAFDEILDPKLRRRDAAVGDDDYDGGAWFPDIAVPLTKPAGGMVLSIEAANLPTGDPPATTPDGMARQ